MVHCQPEGSSVPGKRLYTVLTVCHMTLWGKLEPRLDLSVIARTAPCWGALSSLHPWPPPYRSTVEARGAAGCPCHSSRCSLFCFSLIICLFHWFVEDQWPHLAWQGCRAQAVTLTTPVTLTPSDTLVRTEAVVTTEL